MNEHPALVKSPAPALVIEGFEIIAADDGKPRTRDVDLGNRLGYDRPRDVRKLIGKLVEDGRMPGVYVRAAVARTSMPRGGVRTEQVLEYWLTLEEALLVCMRSDTKGAAAIQQAMIAVLVRVFEAATTRLDALSGGPGIRALLVPEGVRNEWEKTFPPSLAAALCRVYRVAPDWCGGSQPRFLGRVYQKLYPIIVTSPVYRAMKHRTPKPRHGDNLHQHLKEGDPKAFFREQLKVVEILANQSQDRHDFWRRIERHYRGSMLQLALIQCIEADADSSTPTATNTGVIEP